MIAAFKDPNRYVGHGVWLICGKLSLPVKAKIVEAVISYRSFGWMLEEICLEHYGCISIDSVFMNKKEAILASEELLKKQLARYDNFRRQFPGKETIYDSYITDISKRLTWIQATKGGK